jgi:hypothetical protein
LIQTFFDVYYGYASCQTPLRLLLGTTSVLLDSLDDALENTGIMPLPRKVEIRKLIHTFLDVYYGYPDVKTSKNPLRNLQRLLRLLG